MSCIVAMMYITCRARVLVIVFSTPIFRFYLSYRHHFNLYVEFKFILRRTRCTTQPASICMTVAVNESFSLLA